MSERELGRVEVLARVKSGELRVVDAAVLLRLSYRQTKRLRKRYGEEGAAGLKHRSAGRRSNRAYPEKLRRRVLGVVWEKYSGPVGEGFGPTLAAEHLASDDDVGVDAETLRRWMLEGFVEPGAEATATPAEARAQGALWGDRADGLKFSPMAGGAGPRRMPDGPGGRRHEHHAGALGGRGNHLGGGGGAAG